MPPEHPITTPADLNILTEAQNLARPVILLQEESADQSSLAAVWGGVGVVALPAELNVEDEEEIEDGVFYRHWISIASQWLPSELGLNGGCISVYWNDDRETGHIAYDQKAELVVHQGQIPLYAFKRDDLPFIDAVFMAGSPRLQDWLINTVGWVIDEQYNENFDRWYADDEMKRQLGELRGWHSENQPMWAANAAAQIGGWPWSWPDALWNEREKEGWKLILWTFRDSEPWLEVWWLDGQFEVVARIT